MTAVFEDDQFYSFARWNKRLLREIHSELILLPIKSQL
jgi:hypothetical protein